MHGVYYRDTHEITKEILWKSKNSNSDSPGFPREDQDSITSFEISAQVVPLPRLSIPWDRFALLTTDFQRALVSNGLCIWTYFNMSFVLL